MTNKKVTERQVRLSILIIVLLAVALCITTYALFYATVAVEGNYFGTGFVDIDLNGGAPVISAYEFMFAPGMSVDKSFYVQSNSSGDVYFKLYFDNIEGDLAQYIEVTILDGDTVLCQGPASELTRQNVSAGDDFLRPGERRELIIRFYMPEETGNVAQNRVLYFDLCADAVQAKNNPNREFE